MRVLSWVFLVPASFFLPLAVQTTISSSYRLEYVGLSISLVVVVIAAAVCSDCPEPGEIWAAFKNVCRRKPPRNPVGMTRADADRCSISHISRTAVVFVGGSTLAGGWALANAHFLWAFEAGAAAFIGYRLVHFIRRARAGWIYDEAGERQKVEFWYGNIAVYSPTTRQQRLLEAACCLEERRRGAAICFFVLVPSVSLLYYWVTTDGDHNVFGSIVVYIYLLAIIAAFGLMLLVVALFELLYHLGYQDMGGARVLDDPIVPAALANMKNEKVHGWSRVLTENEARRILNPGRT